VRASAFGSTLVWLGAGQIDRAAVESITTGLGLHVRWTTGVSQALAELRDRPAAICLLDCRRGNEALRVARSIRAERPSALLIGVVDAARPETTLDAFRAGVFDVLPWPLVPWDLGAVIANAQDLAELVETGGEPGPVEVSPYGVFGSSVAMRKIVELLPRVAPSRCPILLYGERGTGREMLARAIHGHGRRGDAPFVAVDCSSSTPQELENELFGLVSQRRTDGQDERRSVGQREPSLPP